MNRFFNDLSHQLRRLLPVQLINSVKNLAFYRTLTELRLKSHKSLSQAGQDYWIINEAFAQKKKGYFVEIGSVDGININNTYLLEKCHEWSGICIEANPDLFERLKVNRSAICLNLCLDGKEGEVDFVFDGIHGDIVDIDTDNKKSKDFSNVRVKRLKATTLAHVLKEYNAPNIIDYLSIDVEGAETRILQNFPFDQYIFCCITIERPSIFLNSLLVDSGYVLVKVIPGLDSFYIHKSFQKTYGKNQNQLFKKLRS